MNITWPKQPPALNDEQLKAREEFMRLWHEELPDKYGVIEKFNHGWVANLDLKNDLTTLEVGAGIGAHVEFEDLDKQNYHFFEYRESFCQELRKKHPDSVVICGDIQERQDIVDQSYDRIIAIHVLEHLLNLPKALVEIKRILKDDGYFDIVIPCEGGLAYSLARKVSAERLFRKNFQMDYTPIIKNEHVSTYDEILFELKKDFTIEKSSFFPLLIPISTINLCLGLRLKKLI